ncbi:MAG: diacylglycerol kinase family lipid kinase [Verrucomicrobiota bacterium]|nr:diacylglycerol kinase family lipid kinase [Verrucomicrobiota bacterium]
MRIGLIFNPTAQGDKARRLRKKLEEIRDECALLPTEGPGHAEDLAEQAVEDGVEMLVAAGGDGTVHEVVNGMVRHPEGKSRIKLGVLPLGTVNVLARELKVPLEFESAWRVIRRGHSQRIDLPWMEFQIDGKIVKRCFPALAGAGMDARACEQVKWETKKRSGQIAYLLAGLQTLKEDLPTFTVKTPERTIELADLIMFGNGHMYGGPFDIFPHANLQDGKVDAIVVERVTGWRFPEYTQAVLTGNLPGVEGIHYLQSDQMELIPHGGMRVPVQLDGDAMGQLPAKVSVQPLGLKIVLPEG